MSQFKKYYRKKDTNWEDGLPGQVQKRALILTDPERYEIAKRRFIDLFGLTLWEEVSMVKTYDQFKTICEKYCISMPSRRARQVKRMCAKLSE